MGVFPDMRMSWYIQGITLVAAGKEFVEHDHFQLCSKAVVVCMFLSMDKRNQKISWFLYHESCTAKRGRRRRYTWVTVGNSKVAVRNSNVTLGTQNNAATTFSDFSKN